MNGKRFTYYFTWGNGSESSPVALEGGIDEIRKNPGQFLGAPTPEAIEKLTKRMETMGVGACAECYHGSSYKYVDGVKQSCVEYVYFKRTA